MRVYKYPITITDTQTVMMPAGAKVLCVQIQYEAPCIWALVDDKNTPQPRLIFTHGTGHPVASDVGDYIGTYQLEDGRLIFHVFEKAGTVQ